MGQNHWDNTIMGVILGVFLFYPAIVTTLNNWIVPLIPTNWLILGEFSLIIYGGLLGALIGYYVGKT